jgi:hypothetical protein
MDLVRIISEHGMDTVRPFCWHSLRLLETVFACHFLARRASGDALPNLVERSTARENLLDPPGSAGRAELLNQGAVLGQVRPSGLAVFTDIEGRVRRTVPGNIGGNLTKDRWGDGAGIPWTRQHSIPAGGSP